MTTQAARVADTILNDLDAYAGLPRLGYLVSWRASGVELQHALLEELLTREGFGKFVPDPPTAGRALKRAITRWIKEGEASRAGIALAEDDGDDGTTRRALIRSVNRDGKDWLCYTVVSEDVDYEELGVEHDTMIRFMMHKETKQLQVTTEKVGAPGQVVRRDPQIEAAVVAHWQEFATLHNTGDILKAVREIIRSTRAVAVRREGGAYFVPVADEETVLALRRFFNNVEAGSEDGWAYVLTLPQLDVPGSRDQLARAANSAIVGEIQALEGYLDTQFASKPEGTVSAKTIAAELDKFRNVRAKATMYQEALGLKADQIAAMIGKLEEKARAIVTKASEGASAT